MEILVTFSKVFAGSRVLVTGGTDFFGKRLASLMESVGCTVDAVGTQDCDLRELSKVYDLMSRRYDIVIHAAAVEGGLGFLLANSTKVFVDNQSIHANLVAACVKFPPKTLIGIGSACAYPSSSLRMGENDFWNGPLDESVLTYGFTKKSLFVGQYSLFQDIGLPGAHLVLGNLYGPGDNFDPISAHVVAALIDRFYRAIQIGKPVSVWGDGRAERDLLYVDDAVEGVLRSLL